MARVVAIEVQPAVMEVLEAASDGFSIARHTAADPLPTALSAEEVDAVVIGEVDQAIRLVRRLVVTLSGTPILAVMSEPACRRLASDLRFAPFGAREVHCLTSDEAHQLPQRVRVMIERRRRSIATQRTLRALNRRIDAAAAPTRAAAALLGRLLDIAPIGVAITDPAGRIRELNSRAAQLLESPGAAAIGRDVAELFTSDDQPRVRALLEQLGRDLAKQPRGTFTRETDGRPMRLELTGASVASAAGRPGLILVLEDTTERHALLEELRTANRAKDEFIAMLGHELRNPLAPIRTALDLLRMRNDPSIERECTLIGRHIDHVVQLVDDLLDVARIAQGKLELRRTTTELAPVISRAVEQASPLFEQRRHTLHVDIPQTGLTVRGDASRLAQAFANLLTNAAKYTQPGGQIWVVASRESDQVAVVVRDNGSGIAPEMLPHIFERFVQERQSSDRSMGGLGLGLAIVESLIHLHGGTVDVASELGRGSEFTVRLPLVGEPVATDERKPVPARELPRDARVLIVDDNVDAAELLGELVATMGLEVRLAHDGPSALAAAAPFVPDVVLLDLGLPVMDGYELAVHLRALPGLGDVRLIAISGYAQPEDRARTAAAGFFAHLVKPVSLDALHDVLTRALPHGAARSG